jgi:hypothetical protein
MSDVQHLYSPDQRFFVLLAYSEMRMSHWIANGALYESVSRQEILRLGDSLWSTEQVTWRSDSACLTVTLHRYPGDAPALLLDIYPDQHLIVSRTPLNTVTMRFDQLDLYLERYYQPH